MSRSIDERIVEMQFNNRQFESGVKESIGSLDRLKKGLDLDGASKSLNGLSEVGRKFSLAGIAEGVDTIAGRFTTLGLIGVTAIQNIANSAINAGKKIVSALSVEPITQGFQEYELKMGSIQTIMAGTGASLDKVNEKLEELNVYSDKTIYSFSDMTSNIGKFTNAGVSLDNSVAAIKGIANAAALSGSNSNEASRAMYNFAQALSSGYVKLIDWKSIELANMATVEFKNQLLESAVAAGTLTKTTDGMYKTLKGTAISATHGFNDSLQEQWMTTDALVKTLNDYADETTEIGKRASAAATEVKTFTQLFDTLKEAAGSGWAKTGELIVGDFDEAKKLLTGLNVVVGGFIDSMSDARNNMLQFWKDNGGRDALIETLKNAFGALGKVIKPIGEAFRQIFPPMTGEKLLAITNSLKTFTETIKIGEETVNNIKRTFAGFFATLSIGKQAISAIATGVGKLIKAIAPGASSLLDFTANIGDWLVLLDDIIRKGDIFNKAIEKIAEVIDWVADKVGIGVTAIINFFKGFKDVDLSGVESFTEKVKIRFEPFSKFFEFVGKVFTNTITILKKVAPLFYAIASKIGEGITKLQEKIIEMMDGGDFNKLFDLFNKGMFAALLIGVKKFIDSMSDVTGGFAGILDGVKGSLEGFQSSLKAGVLLKIATAIGILAVSLAILAAIDSEKLAGAMSAITVLFVELFASMAILTKIMDSSGFKGIGKVTSGMTAISIAVLLLSTAMSKLGEMDWGDIAKGLISVGALMAMLVASTKILSEDKSMIKGATGLLLFAAAINILAAAVKKLGDLDPATLAKGLVGVGVLIGELALFMKATDLNKMGINKGIGILLLATAMLVLSSAVEKLGKIDLDKLGKGLGAMAIILLELGLFINATPDAKKVVSTATGLVILGAAMLIFASAIEKMGEMTIDQIGRGLLAMAGALTAVTLAVQFMPKNMVTISVGMIGIATALLIISKALSSMGGMTWDEIARGLVTLAGALTIIVVAMQFMTTGLAGAAAMLAMAASIAILTPALKTLGSMDLAEIGKALLALVGVFAVVGVSGLLLAPLAPVILLLAGAIALLGVGVAAIGVGLLAFSAGLTALSVAGAAGTVALVAIVTALVGLIPLIIKKVGEGIIALAVVIKDGMPIIMDAIRALALGLIEILVVITPDLVEAILVLLLTLLEQLVDYIPKMVDAGMQLIVGVLKGIADNIDDVVATGIEIVLQFMRGISSKIPDVIDTAFKMVISFINGLADAIRRNDAAIFNACENLVDAIIGAFKKMGTRIVSIGSDLIGGMIEGIKKMGTKLVNAAKGVINNAIDGAKRLLGINSPSKVFAEIGKYTGEGLIVGLKGMSGKVVSASKDLGGAAISSMKSAVSKITDALENDMDMVPTIRPVIDMTDVENGLKSTFDKNRGIALSSANTKASSIVGGLRGSAEITNSASGNQNGSSQTIKNEFSIASLVVREESDIKKIAKELYNMQRRSGRAMEVSI